MRLAVVGSIRCSADSVRRQVAEVLDRYQPKSVLTGDGGSDIELIVGEEARSRGLELVQHKTHRISEALRVVSSRVAIDCDALVRLTLAPAERTGSGWSYEVARELRKQVDVLICEPA